MLMQGAIKYATVKLEHLNFDKCNLVHRLVNRVMEINCVAMSVLNVGAFTISFKHDCEVELGEAVRNNYTSSALLTIGILCELGSHG